MRGIVYDEYECVTIDSQIDNLKRIIAEREIDIACLEQERKYLLYRIAELEDALLIRRATVGGWSDDE
jgi:hypothetical protein